MCPVINIRVITVYLVRRIHLDFVDYVYSVRSGFWNLTCGQFLSISHIRRIFRRKIHRFIFSEKKIVAMELIIHVREETWQR